MTQRKIALITGGSRGLGRNAALQLADKGIDVIITYRAEKDKALEVVSEIKAKGQQALAIQLDVADTASFDNFFNTLSEKLKEVWDTDKFNYLINNAGIDAASLISQTSEEAFDSLFNVHFKGVYFLTQKALPLLADSGRIINISTGLTRFTTLGYAAYASMKGAIEVFTKYLAKEVGSRGITANVVAPGIIETDFTRSAFESHANLNEYMSAQTALGRVGQPEDIGGVIAFLCSEDARWVNAQRIEASGGMFL
ncbi:SDR family NAD(P)-dependent oxidoreductase [Rubrolithibacter danxiaensis]|uniref:SDR family NAD(P)-dependent oxidoreductase n=1 Tax=Rubrolithibacter danxiaensis TaxID=3390805 RepID=UPI003BF8FD52